MVKAELAAANAVASHALLHPLDIFRSLGPTLNEATCGLLGKSFDPDRDIQDLSGKVIFVTGGNAGLGKETILQLARHGPSRIYLAARNATKAQEAITSIQKTLSSPLDIRHIPLDLTSFASIRAAAAKFTSECDRLDLLVLNAGTMANPPDLTKEGFEIQLGTNHIGHFLLTKLLLPTLRQTITSTKPSPDVRVITLTSVGSHTAPSFDVMTSTLALLEVHTLVRYGASKAANLLFAAELARRYPEIMSVSVHPGVVSSGLYRYTGEMSLFARAIFGLSSLFSRNVRTGAMNQLWAAGVDRRRLKNGAYYVPIGARGSSRFEGDAYLARRLWEWTEEQIAAHP
ncbi:hypothetical protein FE257_001732 [Aspergillus nanangensis]|uniref:Short-chain dehydrogenase/reductase family protein n=1 Tax=Aspergillus nanangensis TaxID=2582783 RepID=A0AAD4GPI3_ASPNN|nr:hypothetical protein FE257_001732 [Aspergillus nanangensis]